MPSSLLPIFEKRIKDATNGLLREQIDPWLMMRQGLHIKDFNGSEISYEGIEFEGSPQTVFWSGYITRFLEDLVIKELQAVILYSKEREVDAKVLLPEVQKLLQFAVRRIFQRMVEVEQRLMGKGYPSAVTPRVVEPEVSQMIEFIDLKVSEELQMWKPKSAYERWFERNKFLVWLVTVCLTIIGFIVNWLLRK